jgi:acyl carrier protein
VRIPDETAAKILDVGAAADYILAHQPAEPRP